jgi:molybdopterin-biosynthesis enzyme MoeA-like protein
VSETPPSTPRFGLLVIGDEILSGKREDRHFAKVIELLRGRGLRLAWAHYLPDDRRAIAALLRRTFSSDDVVFSCGGIGSTPDDHTRQAAAEALGEPLCLHPEAAALIAQRCAQMAAEGRGSADMSTAENRQRLKMGEFPRGALIIPNPFNQIAGFNVGEHWFVPGFPIMAWPMIEHVLDVHYACYFNLASQAERSLLVFDVAESRIVPLLEATESRFAGIRTFSLPSVGDGRDGRPARRHIEVGVKGGAECIDPAFAWLERGVRELGLEVGRTNEKKEPG